MAIGIKRPPIFKIFCTQLVVSLLISALYYFFSGRVAAYSALLGGLIFVIPQLYFGIKAFMFSGARAAKMVAAFFYLGEVLKILITIVLFSIVYVYTEVELVPLKLTYLLVLGINIFAPVLFINNKK